MEMFLKPFVATFLVLFLVIYDVSLATMEKKTERQKKESYIVHMAKSEMPSSFGHHSIWYDSVLKSVSNSAEMLYTYHNVIHGFSTRLTPEEVRLLRSTTQAGILKVLPEQIYKLHTTRTPHFLGLDKIADMAMGPLESSYGGRGTSTHDVIVGLLDTGVWPESKSFDDTGLGPIPSTWKGKCESSVDFNASSCNKKLIGARFYLRGYEAEKGPIKGTKSPRDDDGHGSHTASTAAGSAVEGASLFGYASGTARGMAPRARVAVYKVCWEDSCTTSDVLAGMDAAISDNVDVISMSLGGEPSISYDQDVIAVGAFAAMEKGIVVSSSAGNNGPEPLSLGSNVAPWVITVGAGTLDRDFPAYVSLGSGRNYSGVSIYSGHSLPKNSLFPIINAGKAASSKSFIADNCVPGSLDPKKVKGKIVLCELGGISMVEKGFAVKSAGGVGMVLGTLEEDAEEQAVEPQILPTTILGIQATKAIIKYLSSSHPKPTATIVSQGTKIGIKPSPVVAEFSSRGPNPVTPQVIKPDLIAPGVHILGAWTRHKGPTEYKKDNRRVAFNILSGTSMSCPHVSGVAALIKSVHPDWSPAAIRSALMTTAYSTYTNGQDLIDSATNKSSTPFDIGSGHVNPVAALDPGLVYDLAPDDYLNFLCALHYTPKKIAAVARRKFKCDADKHYQVGDLNYPSFSVIYKTTGTTVVKHTRTLTNVGVVGTYKVSVTVDIPSVKITVEPKILSFKRNEKKSYTVTFATSVPPLSSFGFGRLEWSNGKHVVGSPISIFTEPPKRVEY